MYPVPQITGIIDATQSPNPSGWNPDLQYGDVGIGAGVGVSI